MLEESYHILKSDEVNEGGIKIMEANNIEVSSSSLNFFDIKELTIQ